MRSAAPIRILGLLLAAGLGLSVSGCAQPAYRFVGNSDRDVVFRVPHDWTPVDDAKALKASGIDPGAETGWTAFYDASAHPGVADVADPSADYPLLFAESVPLTKAQGAAVTPDALRDLLLPGTADDRTAAEKAHVFTVLGNQTVSLPGASGAHVRYSYVIGSTPEIFDRIVLTDPKHRRLQMLFVHCTQRCYTAHAAQISAVVNSLTLKSS